MAKVVPVTAEGHSTKGWLHPQGYGFAASQALVPIGALELVSVVVAMPVAFIKEDGRYVCVAIMGLEKGKNLFVGPLGQWLGKYVPATLRGYPFSLRTDIVGESLQFDEASGLIADKEGEKAEKFFDADGTLSAATSAIVEFLRQFNQDRALIDSAIAALADADVIVPWPVTVAVGNRQVTINGLYRVDEQKLNNLDDETFLKLRRASALLVAFAQLLSMAQIGTLARLALIEQQMALVGQQPPPANQMPI